MSMASRASSWVALRSVPSRAAWLCGCTTWNSEPPPRRRSPLIVMVSWIGPWPPSSFSFASRRARSGLPGA
ncbi:hypothetical protein KCH_56050 [Kitasatospora cheerisanensis KCTC 2395]|uniref:Secreted protein n=1 Tax=Kitasatospora cheerisanensis KCTC 2395 TaxID=1348663 RepID=A0A066YXR9_9ACTN|nr:hypothetical protein KCH_56050 [Kitasatospora cheerisanensis KCTC 2395]